MSAAIDTSGPKYLTKKIVAWSDRDAPRYGMTQDGYTKRSGAPTPYMIKLEGERIWRRVMCWCFSNSGTLFVRVNGECLIISGDFRHETGVRHLLPYFTCVLSYTEEHATPWHPTERFGSFSTLVRGCFQTAKLAHDWAGIHGIHPSTYVVKKVDP